MDATGYDSAGISDLEGGAWGLQIRKIDYLCRGITCESSLGQSLKQLEKKIINNSQVSAF